MPKPLRSTQPLGLAAAHGQAQTGAFFTLALQCSCSFHIEEWEGDHFCPPKICARIEDLPFEQNSHYFGSLPLFSSETKKMY